MSRSLIAGAWLGGLNDTFIIAVFGIFLAVVLGCIVWGARRAYTPRGFALYWLMWLCMACTGICAVKSTWPSSAPRRKADGTVSWIATRGKGRSKSYTLGLELSSGVVLPFRSAPIPPFFAEGRRDVVSVTYLDEQVTGDYPRAIAFDVLTGPRAGYRDAVSADWFGPWLGLVFGPLSSFAALRGAYRNKRPKLEKKESSLYIAG